MLYNIQFQVAGLLLVILTVLLLKRKVQQLYTQRTYILLLSAVSTSICLDILSVIMIMEEDGFGKTVTHSVCKIYLFSIVFVAYALWCYTVREVYGIRRIAGYLIGFGIFPLLAHLAYLFVSQIQHYQDGMVVYTYGNCVTFTYVVSLTYLLLCLLYTFCFIKIINRYACHAIWFLIGAWMGAAIIQLFNNELLIVSFAMGLAMMYMYIRLENPAAYIDGICQVFNVYAYTEYLQKMIQARKRLWITELHIEGIRFVEEKFGIQSVRLLLRSITAYLQQTGNKKGLVFRTSNNSFGIVYSDEKTMLRAVDQITARFRSHWQVGGVEFSLGAGIAYMPDSLLAETPNELMDLLSTHAKDAVKRSDAVMIEAKAVELRHKRKEAEKALQWAVETDSLQVYYQPIYSIKDGKIMALEALVRIVDEDGRCFMPDAFISLAEKNGMILKLGECVLRKVCDFMQKEKLTDLGIEYVEVNLSVIQCMQENLAKQFLDIMAEKQVAPYRINLEITETAAVHSEKVLLRNMEKLSEVGTAFSLDDYGTGYSSLGYVLKMPVRIIKIDKEMVWSYFSNAKSAIAMRHEVAMIHELGLEIVAEGVEDEDQFAAMKELGIDYIQGYYFSRPIPPEELLEFLKDWL